MFEVIAMKQRLTAAVVMAVAILLAAPMLGEVRLDAQQRGSDPEHTLPLTWDRWLDHDEIGERMQLMQRTWPNFLSLQSLGSSFGGREMWLMTINNPATGSELDKAGMFIEANVHGNEIQGAEVALYTIWYLMENYGEIEGITRLVDERVFYVLPTVNPDGRDYFLDNAGSGARTGHIPVDSDGDGLFDEDPPNDLNGNGVIEQIRKYTPGAGTFRVSDQDPRIMVPVEPGSVGDWTMLGSGAALWLCSQSLNDFKRLLPLWLRLALRMTIGPTAWSDQSRRARVRRAVTLLFAAVLSFIIGIEFQSSGESILTRSGIPFHIVIYAVSVGILLLAIHWFRLLGREESIVIFD